MLSQILRVTVIVLEVLLIFNLLIIVHEWGHYLAARWRGLVVEKFGVWFGKPLWKKKINGVEYSLGSIPFGGFVSVPQLAPMDMIEGKTDVDRATLPSASAIDKIIVAVAGPLFSFLLALVFACIVWFIGRPLAESETTTVLGYVVEESPAAKAGLQAGDRLLEIDGYAVRRWGGMGNDSVTWRIVRSEGDAIRIKYERNGAVQTTEAAPEIPQTSLWRRKGLRQINIFPAESLMVGEVQPGTPAEKAGLRPRDILRAINGRELLSYPAFTDYINDNPGKPFQFTVERNAQTFETPPVELVGVRLGELEEEAPAATAGVKQGDRIIALNAQPVTSAKMVMDAVRSSNGQPIQFTIVREGKELQKAVTPAFEETKKHYMIGAELQNDFGVAFDPRGRTQLVRIAPSEQLYRAARSIVDTVAAIASRGSDVKLQHMGGPVMMMRAYYQFFQMDFADGWRWALWFSVVLNVNLALINLLPLPVLDGGHIVLAIIEGIRRKPISIKVLEVVQSACAMLIIGFMIYIFFFDVGDLFGGDSGSRLKFRKAPTEQPAD